MNKFIDKTNSKNNLDPVIAAQAKALEEQCEAKGYAVIIALENEDENASSFQSYGQIKELLDCVTATVIGVYDSLGDQDGLKNLYHKILLKTVKYLPDLAGAAHKILAKMENKA